MLAKVACVELGATTVAAWRTAKQTSHGSALRSGRNNLEYGVWEFLKCITQISINPKRRVTTYRFRST